LFGEDIKPEGIRLLLDEEGLTDKTERLIVIRKIVVYLNEVQKTLNARVMENAKT